VLELAEQMHDAVREYATTMSKVFPADGALRWPLLSRFHGDGWLHSRCPESTSRIPRIAESKIEGPLAKGHRGQTIP
jgi:hypothetical protein